MDGSPRRQPATSVLMEQKPLDLFHCSNTLYTNNAKVNETLVTLSERLELDAPPHPRHPIWGKPGLPAWVTEFRQHQWDCAREIIANFASGVPLVFLDGPTGAGKTLIAEMVRRLLGPEVGRVRYELALARFEEEQAERRERKLCLVCGRTLTDQRSIEWGIGPECAKKPSPTLRSNRPSMGRRPWLDETCRAVYVCSGKGLQDQFLADFDYARVLKGRANYPTLYGRDDASCADCNITERGVCLTGCHEQIADCKYLVAKGQAQTSDLAVLNTAYFLGETGGHRTVFGNGQFDLGIFDEADTLEGELMGHVEVAITSRRMKELGIGLPEFVTKPESWELWVKESLRPAIGDMVSKYPTNTTNLRVVRERRTWERLDGKVETLVHGGVGNEGSWVFDGYKDGGVVFKPVRVDEFGKQAIWRHFDRFLLMSATLISADEMVESLGYDGEYRVVSAPMTFPVENRRVIVAPVANMTNKEKEAEWPKAANAITHILLAEDDDAKVLVHTVSYALADYLKSNVCSDRKFLTYRNAQEREEVLAQFRNTPGAVIFAPSLERGVDLKDDDCRVCIVAKMAFPYLGDKQTNARLHSKGGQLWYSVQTVRSLVQSTGRGVRTADDYCTTYIVDRQFVSNVWKKNKFLLPGWWKDAVDMSFNANTLRG